tara:strand:+ start:832 stop:1122 length:291 start_codon:yes stop_codon:yes gene_type:complete
MALLKKGSVSKKVTEPYLVCDELVSAGIFPSPKQHHATSVNPEHTLVIPQVCLAIQEEEMANFYDEKGFDLCPQEETSWSKSKAVTRYLIVPKETK